MGGKAWSEEHKKLLLDLYPTTRSCKIAEMVGRPVESVMAMARFCGVKKADGYLAIRQRELVESNPRLAVFRRKHGRSTSGGAYASWIQMRSRCEVGGKKSKNHGNRGIRVCARWADSFENFLADMGERPNGMSIGRIDNDGDYEPGNCRWETPVQQARNTRVNRKIHAFGQTKVLAEWCEQFNIDGCTVLYRIGRGMEPEVALTKTPLGTRPDVQGVL